MQRRTFLATKAWADVDCTLVSARRLARLVAAMMSLCAFLTPATAQAQAEAGPATLNGRWSGTYSCLQAESSTFELTLSTGDTGPTGLFTFTLPDGRKGSYAVLGRQAADGRFMLLPSDWVERPSGIQALTLQGSMHDNGLVISGIMPGCGGTENFVGRRLDESGAQTQASIDFDFAPVSGGAAAGTWRGEIVCGPRQRPETVPLTATILQDGEGLVAKLAYDGPVFPPSPVILTGNVIGTTVALQQLMKLDNSNRSLKTVSGRLDAAGQTLTGTVGQNGARCRDFQLTRTGDPQMPDVGAALAGNWAGATDIPPMDRLESSYVLVLAHDGKALQGELRLGNPANRPVAEQDKLVISLAPIHAEGAKIVMAPIGARLAEGIHRPQNSQSAVHRHWLIVMPETVGAELGVRVVQGGRFSEEINRVAELGDRHARFFRRVDAAVQSAMTSGETPPKRFGAGIGGAFAAASSMERQCQMLADWAAPFNGDDLDRQSVEKALKAMLPIFEDSVFEPIFGLPYMFMTDPVERREIGFFLQRDCPQRFGIEIANVASIAHAFTLQNTYAGITTAMIDRRESVAWIDATVEELGAMGEDTAAEARLATIRLDAADRLDDVTAEEAARFETAYAARRDRIEIGLLFDRIARAEAMTDDEATLAELAEIVEAVSQSPMEGDEHRLAMERIGTKATQITAPLIAAIRSEEAELGTNLAALSALNGLEQRTTFLTDLRNRGLPIAGVSELSMELYQTRNSLLDNMEVAGEFQAYLTTIEPGDNARMRVTNAAYLYLTPEELAGGAPFHAQILETTIFSLEQASMEIVDSSGPTAVDAAGSSISGEPSARDMAMAILAHYRQGTANFNGMGSMFPDDPFGQPNPLNMIGEAMNQVIGEVNLTLAYFEKLGCASASGAGQAGYNCDYIAEIRTDNAMLGMVLPQAGMRNSGRFTAARGGWMYLPDLE
jgi:hypothetical protein